MKKVFCSECKYFWYDGYSSDSCEYIKNKYKFYTHRDVYIKHKRDPKVINSKNNCKWFLKKKFLGIF